MCKCVAGIIANTESSVMQEAGPKGQNCMTVENQRLGTEWKMMLEGEFDLILFLIY